MKKLTILSLPVIFSAILIFATSLDAHARKIRKKDLIGTWQICNPDSTVATNVQNYDGLIRYKVITSRSFMVSSINTNDKEILDSFWGSYTLKNNVYTESVEFVHPSWGNIFGMRNSFEIYIKDNLLFIKGINNQYSEIWKKVDRNVNN